MFWTQLIIILIEAALGVHGQCHMSPLTLQQGSGSISSPNYPGEYEPNQHCTWKFTRPQSNDYMLVFNVTDVKLFFKELYGSKSCTGSLKIGGDLIDCTIEGPFCFAYFNSQECQSRRGQFCAQKATPVYPIIVQFHSNNNWGPPGEAEGFRIDYQYVKCSEGHLPTSTTTTATGSRSTKAKETTIVGGLSVAVIAATALILLAVCVAFILAETRKCFRRKKLSQRRFNHLSSPTHQANEPESAEEIGSAIGPRHGENLDYAVQGDLAYRRPDSLLYHTIDGENDAFRPGLRSAWYRTPSDDDTDAQPRLVVNVLYSAPMRSAPT